MIESKYTPSDAELKNANEHLVAMGITEQQLAETGADGQEHYFRQQVDATGREILRSEVGTDNVVQAEYQAGEGEKAGQEWKREYTNITTNVESAGFGTMPATIKAVGETTKGAVDGTNEPWAHLEVSDATALEAFRSIPAADRKPNAAGSYAQLNRDFGAMPIKLAGRNINLDKIGRVSVDFDPDGNPIKATIHKIIWSETGRAALSIPTADAEV